MRLTTIVLALETVSFAAKQVEKAYPVISCKLNIRQYLSKYLSRGNRPRKVGLNNGGSQKRSIPMQGKLVTLSRISHRV